MTILRKGFTTGTCAQAATKGALIMLTQGKSVNSVEVTTPSGVKLRISLIEQELGDNFAGCAVIKDSGDDPDVTNGAKISAKVRFSQKKGVMIRGGEGVGKATKPGLAIGVGEYAINPTPRRMIVEEASKFLSEERTGLDITIGVKEGEELAKKTYNPKLGIMGGISIIGTTGIVEPKSLDAYKASLALQLDVLKAQGYKEAIFVLGYVGEKFCKEKLKLNGDSVIKIGDHIGFMLQECAKRKIVKVLLIGHIGKIIKLTNKQFNTHYSFGDKRLESIARYAESFGADREVIEKILNQETAESAIPILREAGLSAVFEKIAKDVSRRSEELVGNILTVNCLILSLNGELLAATNEI
ncbi:MAG: cobalt-precorrin-5B (C(1))-methyltransferase CbiD [Candidatus Omnitrophota bacterium]